MTANLLQTLHCRWLSVALILIPASVAVAAAVLLLSRLRCGAASAAKRSAVKREKDKLMRGHSREKEALVARQIADRKRARNVVNRLQHKLASSEQTVSTHAAQNERQQLQIDGLKHAVRQSNRQLTQSRYYRGTVSASRKELTREHAAATDELDRLSTEVEGWHAEHDRLQADLLLIDSGTAASGGKQQPLSLFENGQYSDRMRLAVFACLNANVGKDNIGPLIRAITQAARCRRRSCTA
jgi:hypothetical protein